MEDLDTWIQHIVQAENLVKKRKYGFVYINTTNLDAACAIASMVGVDFVDWLNRYFDYSVYN